MSSHTPQGPGDDPGNTQPEYLGQAQTPQAPATGHRTGRRGLVIGAVAVGVVAVVGVGSWGAVSLLSGGGAQPSEAVPANALGYVSLDLDPSASQKIEAFQMMQKFPEVKKELDLDSQDDLRRLVFDAVQEDGTCQDLDYAKDVEPWIGERVALAAVPGAKAGDEPLPLLALQVSDQDAAEKGLDRLLSCGGSEGSTDSGFAISGDYALVSDSQPNADSIASLVEDGALAEDDDFAEWTDKVGDAGIMTMYAAPEAGRYFADLAGTSGEADPMVAQEMQAFAEEFEGMAGVVRFADGAVELEFAGRGADGNLPVARSRTDVTSLPESTVAAFSLSLSDGWLEDLLTTAEAGMPDGESLEELWAQGEQETGLSLPEDIETLLGDGVSIAVDADLDVKGLSQSPDPAQVPAGIRVSGDPDRILPVVEKLRAALGPDADMLSVEPGEDSVSFGLSEEYVASLSESGALGEEELFQDVVPEADTAGMVLYVDLDTAVGWFDELASESEMDGEARENLEPLGGLGISSWVEDDDTAHALFKLTTD